MSTALPYLVLLPALALGGCTASTFAGQQDSSTRSASPAAAVAPVVPPAPGSADAQAPSAASLPKAANPLANTPASVPAAASPTAPASLPILGAVAAATTPAATKLPVLVAASAATPAPAPAPAVITHSVTPTPAPAPPAIGFMPGATAAVPVATAPMYVNTASALFSYSPSSGQPNWLGNFTVNGASVGDIFDIAIDATGHLFAVSTTELYAVNPQTAALTPLLQHGVAGANALTCLSTGALVIAGNGVVMINPQTLQLETIVAPGPYQSSGDIIALPDHMLYWTLENDGGGDLLARVDPNTGTVTVLGNTGIQNMYGLGYANGQLYGFSNQGAIATLSTTTGDVTSELPLSQPQPWDGATTNPVLW